MSPCRRPPGLWVVAELLDISIIPTSYGTQFNRYLPYLCMSSLSLQSSRVTECNSSVVIVRVILRLNNLIFYDMCIG